MRTSSGPVSFESRYSACAISFRDDQLVACSFSRALVKSNLEPRANRRLPFCESKSYWPYACVLLRSYADFLSYPPWSHIILVTFRSEAGLYKLTAARYRACASPLRPRAIALALRQGESMKPAFALLVLISLTAPARAQMRDNRDTELTCNNISREISRERALSCEVRE